MQEITTGSAFFVLILNDSQELFNEFKEELLLCHDGILNISVN